MYRYLLATLVAVPLAALTIYGAFLIRPSDDQVLRLIAKIFREPTPENCEMEDPIDALAFIGELISLREIPPLPDNFPFDSEWKARYRVLEVVSGSYAEDEIEFFAYDHYGRPEFAEYRTVMLYASRCGSFWIHEKYQFDPVYPVAGSGWAGCGDPYQREPEAHRGTIQASPVNFARDVRFSIESLDAEERAARYPTEYFEHRDAWAICKAGASPEQFLEIKRSGVLGSRAANR